MKRSLLLLPDENKPLLPETLAKRELPINFRQDELPLFADELERKIPATRLLEMRDVRVSPEGILFKGGKISIESFAYPWMWNEWRPDKVFRFLAQNHLLRKQFRFEPDALWIVDNWSAGYFHWLADALPRLYAARDIAENLVLLLPHQYEKLEFVHGSLKAFKLSGLRFMGPDEVVSCKRLTVPTHTAPSGHFSEEIIRGVRDLLVNIYDAKTGTKTGGRIYISRGRSSRRTIVNEDEVVDLLREYGFLIVYAEDLSFAEQVSLFSDTSLLVSNHGAGLTNMLFMSAGGNVLELRHQTDKVNNCYFTLASALGLNYFYQTCQPQRSDEEPHTANLVVDVKAFRENIEFTTQPG